MTMVKKLDKLAEEATETEPVPTIRYSANNIWLAGLGAFAMAQEEGEKLFDTLVKEGKKAQKGAEKSAESTVGAMSDKASVSWDKLEQVFEDRVARALHSLSVPTKKDIDSLADRVGELTAVVEQLSASMKQDRPKATTRRAPKKTTTRRATKKPQ